MLTDALQQAGPAALIGTFMGLLPLGYGILYAFRPSERRLAVMRPLSLTAIFVSISATAYMKSNGQASNIPSPTPNRTKPDGHS